MNEVVTPLRTSTSFAQFLAFLHRRYVTEDTWRGAWHSTPGRNSKIEESETAPLHNDTLSTSSTLPRFRRSGRQCSIPEWNEMERREGGMN